MTTVHELPSRVAPDQPIPAVFQRHPELLLIRPDKFPKSVLIIPDGNGRFAQAHGLPITKGHEAGAKALKTAVEFFVDIPEIQRLIVWGFSHDNWKREDTSPGEVAGIMAVTEATILESLDMFHKNKIRFRRIGRPEKIQQEYPSLWKTIVKAEHQTAGYTNKELVIALDFSGEDQDLRIVQKAVQLYRHGYGREITVEMFRQLRDGNGTITPVDLVVRTSGEQRTSDTGWLSQNAEFYKIQALLPDVTETDFAAALIDYAKRERRFGSRPIASNPGV